MDHTENNLRAVAKALTDVVAPSIDPKDPLAREQLKLVVDYVEFLRGRLDLLYERERFELRHSIELGRALVASGLSETEPVAAAVAAGEAVYDVPGAPPAELRAQTARIAAAVRELIRGSSGDAEASRKVGRIVLDASDARIEFERAWYLPLGFDPAPGEVRPLAEGLVGLRAGAAS